MEILSPTGLLTVDDLAELFGISRRTVLDWNSAGVGPKRIRLGKRVFYRLADVQQWIDSKEAL